MIFGVDTYSKNKYSFPDRDDESQDKESADYNLRVAKAVYSEFCSGGTLVGYDAYNSVRINRLYALGNQPQSIYEDSFYGTDEKTNTLGDFTQEHSRGAKRRAYANLNFQVQSPMPRIKDVIVNKLAELVERVSVDATDAYSGAERENAKWGAFVDGKYRKEIESLKALMALPVEEGGYSPKSIEELNLYEAEGGFKLSYEETMERLLKFSFEISNWEENTVERVISDLIDNGFAVLEDVYDKNTGLVKACYVDQEYAGVQYTKESSNYDPDYGFYVKMVKVSELLKRGIETEKLKGVMQTFSGKFDNPNFDDWNKGNKDNGNYDHNGTDRWTVPTFVVKWKDVEFKKERQYNNRNGKIRTKDISSDKELKKGDTLLTTRIKVIREVSWVIATDVVYDYGKCEFQARDGVSEPVLPIHMVQVTGRPIVPRLIPALDQYMNAWMRLQQGISMAAMNGFAINMDAVSNLNLGGKKLDPREVLRMWRQTGTLFFKPTNIMGRMNPGMISRPIEQLPGGAGAVINESMLVMDLAMKQVESLTGFNEISLGGTPNPSTGKAVTEYAMIGTNDVLKGILKKTNIIKSNVARAMCLRLQHVIQADKRAYDVYKDVVGETSLEVVKIANGHDVKYGIRTHARPTEQEKRSMEEVLAIALKNGRDGKVRITEADYFRFMSMMQQGASLKRIALLLDFALEKAQKIAEEKEMKFAQFNQQSAKELDAQKSANEQRKIFMEAQAEMAKENIKGRNDILSKAVANKEMTAFQALSMIQGMQPQQQGVQQPQPQQQEQMTQQNVPVQEGTV